MLGECFFVSMYCRYGEDLVPYLDYLDKVLDRIGRRPILIGMDANAVSPVWQSKMRYASRESEVRGELLENLILQRGLLVLNEWSEYYTFSGMNGESDIDVTVMNDGGRGYDYEWVVMPDWSVSDHRAILVTLSIMNGENEGNLGGEW